MCSLKELKISIQKKKTTTNGMIKMMVVQCSRMFVQFVSAFRVKQSASCMRGEVPREMTLSEKSFSKEVLGISLACNSIYICEFVDNSNYGYDISNAIDYLQMLSFLLVFLSSSDCFFMVPFFFDWI